MYQENSLQMEWCLNCHRNPVKNLRPTSEIYNMAWAGASREHPVWCTQLTALGPTADQVSCTTKDPHAGGANPEIAMLQNPPVGPPTNGGMNGSQAQPGEGSQGSPQQPGQPGMTRSQSGTMGGVPYPENGSGVTESNVPVIRMPASYQEFTDQKQLGLYLMDKYHIRTANQLSSCETCHR
jgi:hypothetical protein